MLEMAKAPASFRRAAREAKGGVLVLTEKGKPAFAVVGVTDDLALEALALRRNVEFMAYLDEISRRTRSEGTRSLRQLEEEFLPRPRRRARRRRRAP
jgi:hypothetical protein